MGRKIIKEFSLENNVMDVEDYLEEIGETIRSLTVYEYNKYVGTDKFEHYSLNEMETLVKDIGGKFSIVRFPSMYGGYDYRICRLPE